MKKAIGKRVKPKARRHIEDIPFYKLKYKKEDLPLDPVKDFILEEISKSDYDVSFLWKTLKNNRFGRITNLACLLSFP